MIPLKYNTASQEIPLGYFVDSTDGSTTETGLTIANTDIKLWKSGATTLANKNSGGATHISDGVYYAVLDATDCNTYGPMKIFVNVSGALPVILECLVMEADAYDALYAAAGTGHIEADAVQISGDATAANNAESFFDGTGYAGTNNTIPTVTTVGTVTTNTDLVTAAAVRTEMDSNSTQLAAIVADTNELQTDDVPGLIAALNDPAAAAIADAVLDEALSGHVVAGSLGKAVADIETDATAILADTNELQTDDVPGLIAALSIPTAAANADAVWDEAIAGHVGAGSTGEALNNATAPTAAAVADAVWEELIADHSGTAGSTAEALNAAGAAGDPWVTALPGAYGGGSAGNIVGNLNDPTAAAIADAVLDEALSGHVAAGSLGKAIADIETDATAILADTNELQTDDVPGLIAALNDFNSASDTVIVSEVQAAALADMFNTDSGTTYGAAVAGSVVKEIADNAGGAALTEAGIADAVWDEAASGHVSAGSFGALIGAMGDTLWDEVINAGAPANAQTARELMNIFASALAGKTNSGSGSQFIGRDLADSKDVITAGLDSDGFRTSMTLDGS